MVRLKMGNLGLRSSRVVSGDGAAARRPVLNGSPPPRRIDGAAVLNGGDSRRTQVDESRTKRLENSEELSNGSHESLGKLGSWIFCCCLYLYFHCSASFCRIGNHQNAEGWVAKSC